jgi:hypothetical protein
MAGKVDIQATAASTHAPPRQALEVVETGKGEGKGEGGGELVAGAASAPAPELQLVPFAKLFWWAAALRPTLAGLAAARARLPGAATPAAWPGALTLTLPLQHR